jgi:predicted kinase
MFLENYYDVFMTPKIYTLIGMVAAGKGTYCKNAAKSGQIILNDDAIVNLLHAEDYTLYDKKLKILYKSVENNILSLGLCIGKSVIIDRGLNVSVKGRHRWIALARSFDIPCEAIVFPLDNPEVHAKRRFDSDNRGHTYSYWLKVANAHYEAYRPPSIEEGFDKIHTLSFEEITNGKVIE